MLAAGALGAALHVATAAPAHALTIAVDTAADVLDAGDGLTSLREAVAQTNTNAGDDTIVLQAGATYTNTRCGPPGTTPNDAGSLDHSDVTGTLTIQGNGATIAGCASAAPPADTWQEDHVLTDHGAGLALSSVTITGGHRNGVKRFSTTTGRVDLVDVSITASGDLSSPDDDAGGLSLAASATTHLTLTRTTIDDNPGRGVTPTPGLDITMTDSSVSRNGYGGMVRPWQHVVGSASLVRSHIDDNGHAAGLPSGYCACGIYADSLTLTDSSVSGNRLIGAITTDLEMVRSHVDRTSDATRPSTNLIVIGSGTIADSTIDGGGTTMRGVEFGTYYAPTATLQITHTAVVGNGIGLEILGSPGFPITSQSVDVTIEDSHIDDNGASGIFMYPPTTMGGFDPGDARSPGATIAIRRSTLDRNGASGSGFPSGAGRMGAVVAFGSLLLEDSALRDNRQTVYGSFGGTVTVGAGPNALSWPGSLTVRRSTISGGSATGAGSPGGVACLGTAGSSCVLEGSTVSGNTGAAGAVKAAGAVTVGNSTVSGNVGSAGAGGVVGGGVGGGVLSLVGSSVVDNSGVGVREVSAGGVLSVDRSVVGWSGAGSGVPGCSFGSAVSVGYSVASDGSCGVGAAIGDAAGVGDVGLAPLGAFGGPTLTRPGLAGSAVLDREPVGSPGCGGTDQRGVARPVGAGCDAGAVETSGPPVAAPDWSASAAMVSLGRGVAALDGGGAVTVGWSGEGLTSGFATGYDSSGTPVWARSWSSPGGYVNPIGVAAHPAGGVIVTGLFTGTFDPGDGNDLVSAGEIDGFVLRLGPTGAVVWSRSFGGPGQDRGLAVAVDPASGDVAVAAAIGAPGALFGPGTEVSSRFGAAAVARYGPDGTLAWAQGETTGPLSGASGIGFGAGGTVVVAGSFAGTGTFGPGGPTVTAAAAALDGFLAVFPSSGGPALTVDTIGAAGTLTWVYSLSVTATGDAIVAGSFQNGPLTGGPHTITNAGGSDGFTAHITPGTGTTALHQLGGPGDELVWDTATNTDTWWAVGMAQPDGQTLDGIALTGTAHAGPYMSAVILTGAPGQTPHGAILATSPHGTLATNIDTTPTTLSWTGGYAFHTDANPYQPGSEHTSPHFPDTITATHPT